MKLLALIAWTCIIAVEASFSQRDTSETDDQIRSNGYIVGVSPSNITHMHGIMIHVFNRKFTRFGDHAPIIYGVELAPEPMGAIFTFMTLPLFAFGLPNMITSNIDSLHLLSEQDSVGISQRGPTKKIIGMKVGIWEYENYKTHGIDINVVGVGMESKGIGVSLLGKADVESSGIHVAGLFNIVGKMRGVQVGVITISGDLQGFQIGLWNRNTKRSLPFINWDF